MTNIVNKIHGRLDKLENNNVWIKRLCWYLAALNSALFIRVVIL